jgi:hypothetical protein
MDNNSLHCILHLPFAWRRLDDTSRSNLPRAFEINRTLLAALALLDQPLAVHEGHDRAGLDRLETKLDLALNLLGLMLSAQRPAPLSQFLRLSQHDISWLDEAGPEPGSEVLVLLHASTRLPLHLTLPARVAALNTEAEGIRVHASFEQLSKELRESLAQWVFREHRREVHARHAPLSES